MFFIFDYSISLQFLLLYASTIGLINCAHECNVIDCEYPYFWFFFVLIEYSHLNAELKVNSRKRLEWLQQIFLKMFKHHFLKKNL